MMALFLALIVSVNALLFRPIFRVLDERDERVTGNRRRAESLSTQADETLARYEQAVREVREDAERGRVATLEEARRASSERGASARDEAEGEITRARTEIAGVLEDARVRLRAEADDLARIAAGRILGRPLS
jgi:F-type H+-transporting ATPase subunit b